MTNRHAVKFVIMFTVVPCQCDCCLTCLSELCVIIMQFEWTYHNLDTAFNILLRLSH